MSADSPPDRELTDEQADALLDRVLERAQERDDVNEDNIVSRLNRRGFLKKGGAAVGGLGLLSTSASSAESGSVQSLAAPDWSNATGNSGTESKPFANLYAQNAYHESVSTDAAAIGQTYVVDASDNLPDVVANRSETIFDLAGQTFEVSSKWTISRSGITIRNGTVKLADGADSDFVTVDSAANDIRLESITWDFNGDNNTGAASSGYLWDTNSGPGDSEFINCDWINGNGRAADDQLRVGSENGRVVGGRISKLNNVELRGAQCSFAELNIRNCSDVFLAGSDAQLLDSQIQFNRGPHLGSSFDGDWIIADNVIEDNVYGLLIETSQAENHTTIVTDNQFQGNGNHAIFAPSGLTGTNTEFALYDNTYKINGGENSDSGTGQIQLESGDGVTVNPAQMTSKPATTDYGVLIGSSVTNTTLEWSGFDDGDFGQKAIKNNAGSQTTIVVPELQTPTDISGSRSLDTTYQNETGGPLYVSVIVQNDGSAINTFLSVNTEQVDRYRSSDTPADHMAGVSAVVPNGESYAVNTYEGESIMKWVEYGVDY